MQADLFQVSSAHSSSCDTGFSKAAFLERWRITLRLDQVVIGLIVLVVLYAWVFSLGVEKGKGFVSETLRTAKKEPPPGMKIVVEEVQPLMVQETVPPPADEKKDRLESTSSLEPKPIEQEKPLALQGRYTVQLISYKTEKAAQKQIEKLGQKGYHGFVIPGGSYLQVCANAFETRQNASTFLEQLRGQGIAPKDAFVRIIS